MSILRKFFVTILCIVVAAAGVFIIKAGLRNIKLSHESMTWPTAPGVVTASEVRVSRSGRGRRNLHAKIVYRYGIDGRTFEGERIAFGGPGDSARHTAEKYPAGLHLPVYYQPSNPQESCLVLRDSVAGLRVTVGVGVVFILAAVGVVAWQFRRSAAPPPPPAVGQPPPGVTVV